MSEKIYRSMKASGTCSLVTGIVVITVGVVSGIMLIISGAKLLKNKSEAIF